MSKLGFRTNEEAVHALSDDGLKPMDIVARTGIARSTVYKLLAKRHAAPAAAWPPERRERLRRIYRASLQVIAEAFGCPVGELEQVLAAAPDPATVTEIEATAQVVPPQPHQSPHEPAVAGPRRYHLVDPDGQLLSRDGTAFTDDPAAAWSGTGDEVRVERPRLKLARYCKPKMVAGPA